MRIKVLAAAGILVLLLVVGWSALRDTSQRPSHAPVAPTVTMVSDQPTADSQSGIGLPDPRSPVPVRARRSAPGPSNDSQAKREELRRAILNAARAARRASEGSPQEKPASSDTSEPEFGPGTIKDRIGGREALVNAINHEFIPLADECIAATRERNPDVQGMLAMGLRVAGDPELGSVIEAVSFGDDNEVLEPELLECIEHTALSTILPPPPNGVEQEEFLITIPIQPENDAS